MECNCRVPCSVSEISIDKGERGQELKCEVTEIDFGSVSFDTESRKVFEIKSDPEVDRLEYTVTFDPYSNPLYRAFQFHYTKSSSKGRNFKCIVWYKPNMAPRVSSDKLQIKDQNGKCHYLVLKGRSLGPLIHISSKSLTYLVDKKKPQLSKTIEIYNKGTVPAKFRFEMKGDRIGCFMVNVTRGILKPKRHVYVTITFQPKHYGVYFYDLYLILLYGKPKKIELLGYYSNQPVDEKKMVFKSYNKIPKICKTGFTGYLYDVVEVCESPPPFSLTNTSLNFGPVDIGNLTEPRTQVTSLMNSIKHNSIKVIWDSDPNGIFRINPKEVIIPPNNSALFECTFNPENPDRYYDYIMSGNVFCENRTSELLVMPEEKVVSTPLCVFLRLLGSSFPSNKPWVPQIYYSDRIVVRAALPNSCSHDSFEMKITGYLPVSYRFIPPKNSRFVVKPNQGVIYDNEIIIIQFSSHGLQEKTCSEKWQIVLNGRENQCNLIYFSSISEKPNVLVNKTNKIRFDNVLPGCYDIRTVTLQNISSHYLQLTMEFPKQSNFKFSETKVFVAANEEITLTCRADAPEVRTYSSEFPITCRKCGIKYAVTGPQTLVYVRVIIKATPTELCALPSVIPLEVARVNKPETTEFELYNFGEAKVYFILLINPEDETSNPIVKEFLKFEPEKGEIGPGEHMPIKIYLNCTANGEFEISVCYLARLFRDSDVTLDMTPRRLTTITFRAEYATLQVIGIADYTHGECFNKAMLWNFLNINKLNNDLRMIQKGETRTIDIYLPDHSVSEDPFIAKLALQNQSVFELTANLKRNKICDCSQTNGSKSLTFRQKTYNCRHRRLLEASLSTSTFMPQDVHTLTISVYYIDPEKVTMSYLLHLPEERTLVFMFYFNILGPTVDCPSKLFVGNVITIPPVALTEWDSPYRAVFFYNLSENPVTVGLDNSNPDKSQFHHNLRIIKCHNPTEVEILPLYIYPLLFQFRPIAYQTYQMNVDVLLGSEKQQLTITSEGVSQISGESSCYDIVSAKSEPQIAEPTITFSTDYLRLTTMTSWSCSEFIVFMKNNSEDLIGYYMTTSTIPGVISVRVINKKGLLKGKESIPLVIYVQLFEVPLKINIPIVGKFLNHTEYFQHKKTVIQHQVKNELLQEEFLITERGEELQENNIVIKPLPKNFYLSFVIGLTSISMWDIDLHMTAEEQLKQSPQYVLNLNEERIMRAVIKHKMRDYQSQTQAGRITRFGCPKPKPIAPKTEGSDQEFLNLDFIKQVLDCILWTAIHSKVFKRSLELHLQSDPPYYMQFTRPDQVYADQKERTANISEEINICHRPLVAEIFRRLICDGLHQVMQLGPPPGSKDDFDYFYDKKFKSQFNGP